MKIKKRMKEKDEFISSLMKDRLGGAEAGIRNSERNYIDDEESESSRRKTEASQSSMRSRIIVSATNTNGKIMGGVVDTRASEQINNKSLSFLLLFLIFSFIFMVIAEGEGGQIGEQEIFSKKGLLSVKPTSNSQWSVVQNTETDFFNELNITREFYTSNQKLK